MMEGKVPFAVPGPAGYWYTGAIIQWKGKEPFAGDQVQTLLENGRFSKQFLSAADAICNHFNMNTVIMKL